LSRDYLEINRGIWQGVYGANRERPLARALVWDMQMCVEQFRWWQGRKDADQIRLGSCVPCGIGRQQVVCPFGDKEFLSAFEGVQGFCLRVPVHVVEDPVVPAIGGHDVISWGRAAGSLVKPSCKIASDRDATDGDGGLRRRDEPDDLGRVGLVVEAVGCMGMSI
jgi:hypothetical protein